MEIFCPWAGTVLILGLSGLSDGGKPSIRQLWHSFCFHCSYQPPASACLFHWNEDKGSHWNCSHRNSLGLPGPTHREKKNRTSRIPNHNTEYWNISLRNKTADEKLGLGKGWGRGSGGGKIFLAFIFVSHHLTLFLFGNKLILPKLSPFCPWR